MYKVLAAIPSYRGPEPTPLFYLMEMAYHAGQDRADRKYSMKVMVGGPKIPTPVVRNTAVMVGLNLRATHLLMIDDDMCPPPDLIPRLLAHNVDIVAPLFFRAGGRQDPLVFEYTDDGQSRSMVDYPRDTLFQVHAGIGTGVILIKMEVFMAMPKPWFFYPQDGKVGMDLTFCRRATECGFLIFCDSTFVVPQMGLAQPVSAMKEGATEADVKEELILWQT
jgi:hypothetical protein